MGAPLTYVNGGAVSNLNIELTHGTVAEQVDRILGAAIASGASDIHIEPLRDRVRIRLRLDGTLVESGHVHMVHAAAIASRIKVMAGLDVSERRKPQDGRFEFAVAGRRVDLRISVMPTTAGEKVVLRLLDPAQLRRSLGSLGMDDRELASFQRAISAPHGLVLVTGPTGSGKTTTLYAALNEIDCASLNVISVEDPVEYEIDGVAQVHARPDLGLGFAEALRSFLRQDPDVILVGEIRDSETARMAVRAALTGHLVLSTLHTSDAASAATRLVDMGVEPFLIAASLKLVVAQRLVRLLCKRCKIPLNSVCAPTGSIVSGTQEFETGPGCSDCNRTGYRGRRAIYEVVSISDVLASAIASGAVVSEISDLARSQGCGTLRQSAERLLQTGVASHTDVGRATLL